MQDKRKILVIEKSLGFKWPRGISRKKKDSCQVPKVKALLDDIEPLKRKFQKYLPSKLRDCKEFVDRSEQLFLKYGPQLWPPPPTDTSDWLVDAAVNDHGGLYCRNLQYYNSKDREKYVPKALTMISHLLCVG